MSQPKDEEHQCKPTHPRSPRSEVLPKTGFKAWVMTSDNSTTAVQETLLWRLSEMIYKGQLVKGHELNRCWLHPLLEEQVRRSCIRRWPSRADLGTDREMMPWPSGIPAKGRHKYHALGIKGRMVPVSRGNPGRLHGGGGTDWP